MGREFELNLEEKMQDSDLPDVQRLCCVLKIEYDQEKAYKHVYESLIQKI